MTRMYEYPILVIVAGLLSGIPNSTGQTEDVYNICDGSGYRVLNITPVTSPFVISSQEVCAANYSNSKDCTLVLRSGAQPIVLAFQFRKFRLESCKECRFDYACFLGVKFCGLWASGQKFENILPAYKESTVHFHTDATFTEEGFQIHVTSRNVDDQVVKEPKGIGSSLGEIIYLPITYNPDMMYFDGCSTTSSQTSTVQTTTTSESSTTSTKSTTSKNTDPESYQVYTLCEIYEENTLNVSAESPPFIVRSPGYPNNYNNSLNCILVLQSGLEPLVLTFKYSAFQLEEIGICTFDSLCVQGAKFCGTWPDGDEFQYILPVKGTFTIRFRTDGSGTYSGFNIVVTPNMALPGQKIYQPQGDGSSRELLRYVQVVYPSVLLFPDNCDAVVAS